MGTLFVHFIAFPQHQISVCTAKFICIGNCSGFFRSLSIESFHLRSRSFLFSSLDADSCLLLEVNNEEITVARDKYAKYTNVASRERVRKVCVRWICVCVDFFLFLVQFFFFCCRKHGFSLQPIKMREKKKIWNECSKVFHSMRIAIVIQSCFIFVLSLFIMFKKVLLLWSKSIEAPVLHIIIMQMAKKIVLLLLLLLCLCTHLSQFLFILFQF